MKNKRTINENLREAASKRSRKLDSIIAASKTSLSRNFSRLPSTIDYLQESTKNLKTATKRDVKQAIDYSQGMIDWSRKGNIDLMGTSYNPTPAEVPFSFGDALVFDGNDDYGNLADSVLGWTSLTFSIWFKLDVVQSSSLLGYDANTNLDRIRLDPANNRVLARNATGGIGFKSFSIPELTSGTWYHLLFADNGTNARLFLNGVESSSGAITTGGSWFFDMFGADRSTIYSNFLDGELDDLLLWNGYNDPAADSVAIYNGGAGVDPLTVLPLSEQRYRFNSNTNNDGSLGGSATLNNFPANPYTPHI